MLSTNFLALTPNLESLCVSLFKPHAPSISEMTLLVALVPGKKKNRTIEGNVAPNLSMSAFSFQQQLTEL